MDELTISGKRFISSRRAAKEHGYHTDYIGQLIRSGKLVGQKVGRAWYVEMNSLHAFVGSDASTSHGTEEPVVEKTHSTPKEASVIVAETKEKPEVTPSVATHTTEEKIAEIDVAVEEVPITLSSSQSQKIEDTTEVARVIPIRTETTKKTKGLVYVREEIPTLPTLSAETMESPTPYVLPVASVRPITQTGLGMFATTALAGLGVLAFVSAGVLALSLEQRLVVEGKNMQASVYFSYPRL